MSQTHKLLRRMTPTYSARLMQIEKSVSTISDFGEVISAYNRFHSERIIENLEDIIPDSVLNEFEIFLLLSSAYMHDIGSVIEPYSRKDHARIGAHFIQSEFRRLGLDPIEAKIVSIICKSHTLSSDLSSVETVIVFGRYEVRLRLLSALLRLADTLDIDYRRTPHYGPSAAESEVPTNLAKFWQSISGVLFKPEEGEIELHVIELDEEKPTEKRNLQLLGKNLQQNLHSLSSILLQYGIDYRRIRIKILGSSKGDLVFTE